MGMAAGQARLLSITSRMSDNELRAQIINNNKMRLATESSQVSEAYINALNQAQMMFTNYDANNNATYQQLTFNALTSYNPYNNQYALANASGQVLVSEKDATNFMNANGDLNTFLSAYGLEKSTTYFDKLNTYKGDDGHIPYKGYDENGDIANLDSGFTAEELETLFFGGKLNGINHRGYDAALSSAIYNGYISKAEAFDNAYTAYAGTIADNITNSLNQITTTSGKSLNDILSEINGSSDSELVYSDFYNASTNKGWIVDFEEIVNQVEDKAKKDEATQEYFKVLHEQIEALKKFNQVEAYNTFTKGPVSENDTSDIVYDPNAHSMVIDDTYKLIKDSTTGAYKLAIYDEDNESDPWANAIEIPNGLTSYKIDDTYTINFGGTLPDLFAACDAAYGASGDGKQPDWEITVTEKVDVSSVADTLEEYIKNLSTNIFKLWDITDPSFGKDKDGNETTAYKNYKQAAMDFINFVYGSDSASFNEGTNNFQVKGADGTTVVIDRETINGWITDPNNLMNFVNNPDNKVSDQQKTELQDVFDVIVLNNIMNTYGEPKVTWIDTMNPNENGEAKAQWYTNLFTRMQSGFKVLQDGLASSTEWIQFALENGLVTMEQVDSNQNWNSIMYSNCSDITEQTNDTAVAIAEAEYNAAMNKIENKDKKYDLELKNIDTEHNSLQTEYDSIKSAIDKNIERSFKIYS